MHIVRLNATGWVIVDGVICVEVDGRSWWPTRAEAEAALAKVTS